MWFYLVGFFLLCIPVFGEIVYLTGLRLRKCCKRRTELALEAADTSLDQSYSRSVQPSFEHSPKQLTVD